MKKRAKFLLLCAVAMPLAAAARAPNDAASRVRLVPVVAWKWHEPGLAITGVSFSRTSREIAFAKRLEASGSKRSMPVPQHSEGKCLQVLDDPLRREDPNVFVLSLGSLDCQFLGFGWDPSFSPDSKKVAFAAQIKPLLGYRLLAATMAGNEIKVFDRVSGGLQTIAKPEGGHFSKPWYSSPGDTLYFSMEREVHDSWGTITDIGSVELGPIEITKHYSIEISPESQIERIGPVEVQRNDPYFVRCRAADQMGFKSQRRYRCSLVKIGKKDESALDFGFFNDGEISSIRFFVLDDGRIVRHWIKEIRSRSGRLLAHRARWGFVAGKEFSLRSEFNGTGSWPGAISPDGNFIVQAVDPFDYSRIGHMVIVSRHTGRVVRRFSFGTAISEYKWAPDSRHLVVIASHYADEVRQDFLHDEIILLRLQ